MRTIVIGANGQLGRDVVSAFTKAGYETIGLDIEDLDVADIESTRAALEVQKPDLVINTAAMHNVEKCEADPARSFAVNGIGARNLAILSNELDFTLTHISTDYVFDGAKKGSPYAETDVALPLNVYGNTKLAGEMFIRTMAKKHFVVRVSAIYGTNPCLAKGGLNFVELMLKLASERDEVSVVDDEFVSPTFTQDIAAQLVRLNETIAYGLYHATSQDYCCWHDFAARIFELTNADVTLKRALPGQFPAKVPRPAWSVLDNRRLSEQGIDLMPHWDDALQRYLTITGRM